MVGSVFHCTVNRLLIPIFVQMAICLLSLLNHKSQETELACCRLSSSRRKTRKVFACAFTTICLVAEWVLYGKNYDHCLSSNSGCLSPPINC